MNADFLKAKTFGMPRWAFLSLLAGGVVLGLYLRSRRQAADATSKDVSGLDTGTLANSSDPGLAGVGVVSPPGGVYPVSTPTLPEGLTDAFSSLTGLIGQQGEALAAIPNAFTPQTPVVNVTLPSGGGPPVAPPKKVPKSGGNTNLNASNPRYGQTFRTVPAKGGVWHIYPGGRRVFVKK